MITLILRKEVVMILKLLRASIPGVFLVTSLVAQTDRGAIKGTVFDPSGGGVPNAHVQARNEGTSILSKDTTNSQGGFTFSALQPGVYEVSAEIAGFKRAVLAGVIVHIGETVRADIPVEIGRYRAHLQRI